MHSQPSPSSIFRVTQHRLSKCLLDTCDGCGIALALQVGSDVDSFFRGHGETIRGFKVGAPLTHTHELIYIHIYVILKKIILALSGE